MSIFSGYAPPDISPMEKLQYFSDQKENSEPKIVSLGPVNVNVDFD